MEQSTVKTYLQRIFLVILVFYHLYPQALGIMGSSFIFGAGIVGLGLFIMHRPPFKELIYVALAFGVLYFTTFLSSWVSGNSDDFILTAYTKSQAGWFFSAYLIIFFLFRFHKEPTVSTLLSYLIAAIALQAICTICITYIPSIGNILMSLELDAAGWEQAREKTGDERLIGYGIGFYGAGYMYGYGLIFTVFIMARAQIKKKKTMFLLAITYVLIFYIGIFTARTIVVGAAVSLILLVFFYMKNYAQIKRRSIQFFIYFGILAILGYSIMYAYFPSMVDWAFELFYNMSEGKVETSSSNGLKYMFQDFPTHDLKLFFFGRTSLRFFGNDVGYVRMIYHSGIIGTIAFYLVSVTLAYTCMSKDRYTNILLIMLVIYEWLINIKGLADIHSIFFLFFFFFMFYKYYKFQPQVYACHLEQKRLKQSNKE